MATVQFSLTGKQFELLQRLSNPGESLNLTAKRILSAALVSSNLSNNINALELESTLDIGLTSTERQFRRLDDRITAIEVGIEANHYESIKSLEERIEKIETELEILTVLSKQPATPNNGEGVIFLANSEGEPIQFWSGQVWVDDFALAYRYKGAQAMARAIDKLKKRKLPDKGYPSAAIAFAPLENLLENYQRKILLGKLTSIPCAPLENLPLS